MGAVSSLYSSLKTESRKTFSCQKNVSWASVSTNLQQHKKASWQTFLAFKYCIPLSYAFRWHLSWHFGRVPTAFLLSTHKAFVICVGSQNFLLCFDFNSNFCFEKKMQHTSIFSWVRRYFYRFAVTDQNWYID